jgi:hypothetical protein
MLLHIRNYSLLARGEPKRWRASIYFGNFLLSIRSLSTIEHPILFYSFATCKPPIASTGNMAFFLAIPAVLLAVSFVLRHFWARYQFNKKYKLPPVIPGWPIIGNSLDVPFPGGMWGVRAAKEYGEM